jgi:L-alanine-DL-glutamate epimerase-like enolase superfamily enzyme
MIISKIETFPLRIPFKPGTVYADAAWGDKNLPAADSLLVKITTDDGLEGWGEAFGFRAVHSAKLAVEELIAGSGPAHRRRKTRSLGYVGLDQQGRTMRGQVRGYPNLPRVY